MLAAVVIKPGDLQIVDLLITEPGLYEALCRL